MRECDNEKERERKREGERYKKQKMNMENGHNKCIRIENVFINNLFV